MDATGHARLGVGTESTVERLVDGSTAPFSVTLGEAAGLVDDGDLDRRLTGADLARQRR